MNPRRGQVRFESVGSEGAVTPSVSLARVARLPDELRVARSLRAPELGPRMVFFSGGSALRPLCRVLKQYTHNSVHLITAFDSGGSSAELRRAFAMPSIGDLRNRIVALADESVRGNPQIYKLFSYRLPVSTPERELSAELETMLSGDHPLVRAIAEPMRQIVRTHLRYVAERLPPGFDLNGANVGNLMLVGGFLANSRDLDSVLFLFSQLLQVRGIVRPIVDVDLHLCAELENAECVVGQHRLTGKEVAPIVSPIKKLSLVRTLEAPEPAQATISEQIRDHILTADLLCLPMGSFYSSVLANLLPSGAGQAVASAGCPRVYIPNTGVDPEQRGLSLADSVEVLVDYVRRDAGADTPVSQIVNLVLVDRDPSHYAMEMDLERVRRMGVGVAAIELVTAISAPHIEPQHLARTLISLV